jgi:hypothetical protein
LARPKAIFGDDDRQEVYEFDDPLVVEAAASTVALIPSSYLTEEEDRFVVTDPESAIEVYGFCPDERFSDQPVVASCSGFLVAEDLVATAGGKSGSPVLNAATYTVEGIVVRGEDNLDFGEGDCLRALRCETFECLPAQVVRATEFADLVPADPAGLVYEVWFGPCGALVRVGETREARWTVDGPLESGRTHCWRVRATGDCGSAEGPVWSFAVGRAVNPFRRGDCNGDGAIDLTDALFQLRFSFLGEVNPPCRSACDVNGDGVMLGLGDALALVAFAYQGGPPPSAPFPACGVAAGETDLLLGCESAPAGCAP